ncbi:MobC family plasmid mobilization relaxosome protein [Diaphorobacter sp. HDW4B]|uniref:plasmid mobilization protein n=1 Tax=Diaphorobacter sp. HDW4B TaxID=2714925 RepID=UPI00140B836A|nr:plasmid mobilization relaxosome protein MobC [Diaphorobacter sp. HDW4B]QIL69974.1 MobC family plasmid mobilization relaxosome protein [Diaphorobacter sp. HDW4B]
MAHQIKEKDPTLKQRAGQTGVEANKSKRTKRFEIRFTQQEWTALQDRAYESGSSSAAIYARSVLLPSQHIADLETKAEQKVRLQLLASFGKIGSNINQIARALNRMKVWNTTTEGMLLELTKIQEAVSTITTIFKERK